MKGGKSPIKADRDVAQGALDRLAEQARRRVELTPERLDALSKLIRQKLDDGDIWPARIICAR